jgi:hypothetical protein
MGGIVKRQIEFGGDTCILGFGGRDYVKSVVFDATTLSEGGTDAVQTITITGSPTGGTFRLTYKGRTTGALAFNASAAAVKAALSALSSVGAGNVEVTGSAGGPYVVTFKKDLSRQEVPAITATASLTGGTAPSVAVTQTTKGSSLNAGHYVLGGTDVPGVILTKTASGSKVKEYTGEGVTNEVHTVTVSGSPTGGTFTLVYEGERTAAIAFNASAATVQTALEGLPNIEPGDVVVTGSAGGPYTVTYQGNLEGQSTELLVAESALTGGTTPGVAVAQTQQGGDTEQILGIFDGHFEFISNTPAGSREVPCYQHSTAFDSKKIKNFADHEAALRRWAANRGCVFESPTA